MIYNKNESNYINSASNDKNPSKFSREFTWTDYKVEQALNIFNRNSHQLFYKHVDFKTNKTYTSINKCGIIKKSWTCGYYGCLPCMFKYLKKNYDILKNELRPKIINRYPCYLLTYKIPLLDDNISVNYKLLSDCIESFKHSSFGIATNYERFLDEIGYVSSIIAFESPFSYADNIHVLHLHECLVAQNQITKAKSLEFERNFNRDYQSSILSIYNNTLNGNYFKLAYDFTNTAKIYDDNQKHYTAIQLLNNFQGIEYLSNPFKLLRGFETLIDNSIQIDKKQTYSPYLNAVYSFNREHYLNFVDNLPVRKTVDFRKNPIYNSAWLHYGQIEGADLREYFRVGEFKGKTSTQVQEIKQDKKVKEILKYWRGKKYKDVLNISDNLLYYIKYRENLNLIGLNETIKKMKNHDDVIYLSDWASRLNNFKLGYYAGYIDTLFELEQQGREIRQLVNHEGSDLPIPQTDNEIIADIKLKYDKFLNEVGTTC